MNSDARPNNQGNPNGSGNAQSNNKNKKKPYYIKRKKRHGNNGNPQNRERAQEKKNELENEELQRVESENTPDVVVVEADESMIPEVIVSIEDDDTPKVHVTGVRFKPGGKVYFFAKGDLEPKSSSYVIVETARGLEFGEVAFGDREVKESALVPPLRPVVRIATDEDIQRNKENKKKEDEAFKICAEKIQ